MDEIRAVNLIPRYILATSLRSMKLFVMPSFDLEIHLAHELYLPNDATDGFHLKCSSVTGGYTPLRGYQLLLLVIAILKWTLVLQPSLHSRPDVETFDTITPPYISPPIVTLCPKGLAFHTLSCEGKCALWRPLPACNRFVVLSISTQGSNSSSGAQLKGVNSVTAPSVGVVAFDEVSGWL